MKSCNALRCLLNNITISSLHIQIWLAVLVQAIHDGFISVTPLHLDLTHYGVLGEVATWWRDL